MSARLLLVVALLAATSCAPASRYLWDGYEESVLAQTLAAADVDLGAQVDALEQTVERSAQQGKNVAPGLHAHLGYLYTLRGELDPAAAAFESEKELYPESAVFVDGLLARMRRPR